MNNKEIIKLREKINKVDAKLLKTLAERFVIVKQIGKIKKAQDLAIENKGREQEVFKIYEELAKELDLNKDFVKELFVLIISQAKKIQNYEYC